MGRVSAFAQEVVILPVRCLRTGVFLRVRKVRWDFNNLRRGTLAGKIPFANSA